ncbi:photosystem II protein PsbQ [Myxacorys almedinensis]|uniref:Photosystem II protein PsbQ n=1 Tax=Myxacorys almedinensis A TaxID=2690445 RepID=A0A8J8CI10_9CYAN|nr:photosystem II protein PsbQ [Myxacorys almedinensis]NDJ17268.1 photosystem II protein PsbQ [Myxacorys almedinensis A]
MANYRSILALVLAIVVALFLWFGNPASTKPVKQISYTSEQIAEIQTSMDAVTEMRDRFPELKTLIDNKDDMFTRNFIHGPLGEMRVKLSSVARNLLPDAQKQARQIAKDVSKDLVEIDRAAAARDFPSATLYYNELLKDLDGFYQLLPQA